MVSGTAVVNGLGFIPMMKDVVDEVYEEVDQEIHDFDEWAWGIPGPDDEPWSDGPPAGYGVRPLGLDHHPEMTGTRCTTWGPSAWNSGKCDMKTGVWYPEGVPDDDPSSEMTGTSCLTWSPNSPNFWRNCDMKTGIWYPEGAPGYAWMSQPPDLHTPGVLSLMPDSVQPQRMRLRPQGSTPHTRVSTMEIAEMAHKDGAVGIFIPAHFYDFVKAGRHNVTWKTMSYYLAYSGPRPPDYRPGANTRPGVFYYFFGPPEGGI